MQSPLSLIDWIIIGIYIMLALGGGVVLSRRKTSNMEDYFLGGRQMSLWAVMLSVLATTQSAATFLGGPDYGYRGDFTYLASYIGAIMAALFVAHFLMTRFYSLNVTTVYELLALRYGVGAKRAAGAMYLIGRVFANGARLYLAAVAVSMMLFFDVAPGSVFFGIFLIVSIGVAMTLSGGIRSVIWSDLGQFLVYFFAAVLALASLWGQLNMSPSEVAAALAAAPTEQSKLTILDFRMDLGEPFTVWAIITGVFLLYLGNYGLDQDTTQRLLTCRNVKESRRALVWSSLAAAPIVFVFILIGQLLYLFYNRPELTGLGQDGNFIDQFDGEKITVFMSYILSEMPSGVRGLVTAGVLAAAISTITSGLNAMSSVLVSDFYKPWKEGRSKQTPSAAHYVIAGRFGMAIFAVLLAFMAVLCFYWQRYTNMALLEFALSVMTFAYAGLIGVYFVAVFSRRGSALSIYFALLSGFVVILIQQSYVVDSLGFPESFKMLAFPWQLIIGVAASAFICALGKQAQEKVRVA
ncbi:sodium:solute symporter [Hyphococcus luteus]|uniref:Sodium:solute symporter n=1 Tax=Hyphococcus luteus TaxID=2058213 RepID=A0A2S7K9X9_9PROT|nr:sodium:solute symporter [Marinicaulis flavus]PQA89302.1 sodium:solute symporter [Marinicaulis flavus]